MGRKNLYLASLPLLVLVPSFLGATAAFGLPPKQQRQSPSILTFASTSSNPVLLAQLDEPSSSDDRDYNRDRDDNREYDHSRDYNRDLPPVVVPETPQPDSPTHPYRDDNREYDSNRNRDRDNSYNRKSPEIPDPWSDSGN